MSIAHIRSPRQLDSSRAEPGARGAPYVANAEAAEVDPDTDNLLFSALRAAERAAEGRIHARPAPAPAPNVTRTKEPGPTSK